MTNRRPLAPRRPPKGSGVRSGSRLRRYSWSIGRPCYRLNLPRPTPQEDPFRCLPIPSAPAASRSGWSGGVAFNMLHAKCGSRIKQQTFCPVCNVVVDRAELVRGYEFAKDQYVRVSDDELKSLEGEASKLIDIAEFVPLDKVDPIYF